MKKMNNKKNNRPAEIIACLVRASKVLLISHVAPDGDTLGSALGLAAALRRRSIEVRLACADPVPAELRFLPGSEGFAARGRSDEDLIVVLDTGDLKRIGSLYSPESFAAVPVINIDHHVTNVFFGDLNWVEPRAATAELVLDLLLEWGIPLAKEIATPLLTGIITDTQGFRTSSTTAESLRAAITLMEAGASLPEISEAVFNRRSLATLRLWGMALAQAQFAEGVLWVEISREMLAQVDDPMASRGLANFLSTFAQARVAAVFRELDGVVEISLRSAPGVDVSEVALRFGGGGHPQAAGCTVEGELARVRSQVLEALFEVVRTAEEERG